MSSPLPVSQAAVRRFLLDCQGLPVTDRTDATPDASPAHVTPERVLQMLRGLECIQVDPVMAVERNEHLALSARLPGYSAALLEGLINAGRAFEYWANGTSVLPMEDYPLFEPIRQKFRARWQRELAELQPVVSEVLARLEAEGPLPARAFRSPHRVHGFWDNKAPRTKATSHALNLLMDVGEVVVRRKGGERYFELARRAIPAKLLRRAESIDPEEANAGRLEKYLRAYRVIDRGDPRFGWSRMTMAERLRAIAQRVAAGKMVPLSVEGVRRPYFVLAEDLERLREYQRGAGEPPPASAVRFLPPLDNLLWRRERVADLFNFDYTWEIYLRPEKRRYGYYAMPILMGDRLIGRIDPRLDRERGRLIIQLLQLEPWVRVDPGLLRALRRGVESFACEHDARDVEVVRTEPEKLRL